MDLHGENPIIKIKGFMLNYFITYGQTIRYFIVYITCIFILKN